MGSLPAVLAIGIVKWVYGTWENEKLQTATAKPGRVMILIMLLLLSVEAFSVWIAFNKGCLRVQRSWNVDDVILMTFVVFLAICIAGAAGTFLAFAAGWFQASKIDGPFSSSLHATVNQMMCITSSYFSMVFFCFAAVLAIFGVWMLVAPVALGLLGAVYLVAAVLLLQGSVSLLDKRNPNHMARFVMSFHRAQAAVDQHPEKLLDHVHLRKGGGLSEHGPFHPLLRPSKKDCCLFVFLLARMGINIANTVLPAARGVYALAGVVFEWPAELPSAQQLIVNLIEAVFVVQFLWQLLKTSLLMHFLRQRLRAGLIESLPSIMDSDQMLHRLHGNMSSIANYSLLRSISALNISKAIDIYQRSGHLQFFQAIVHGILAVISLSLKVSAVSPILAVGVANWRFADWRVFVAFINNISGITNLKEIESRVLEEFIFGDDMQIASVEEKALFITWRSHLSLQLLQANDGWVFKSLAVINGWSTKKTQAFILRRDCPRWIDEVTRDLENTEATATSATA